MYNFTKTWKVGPLVSHSAPREEAAALWGFCHRGKLKLLIEMNFQGNSQF